MNTPSRTSSPRRPARLPLALAALAVLAGLAAAPASAVPITHLAGATAQTSAAFDRNFAQQTSAAAALVHAPDATRTETVATSANLAAGQVHARIEATAVNAPDSLTAFGAAFIGDSFRHASGSGPFHWTGTTEARFDIHIDGTEQLDAGDGEVFNFAQLALIIYQPGSMDDSLLPYCGATVIRSFFWTLGSQAQAQDPCGGTPLDNLSGAVDQNLSASFTPGGDFDWIFGIVVGGVFNANLGSGNTGNGHWLQDFGNTATLSYTAPAGATVFSGSGVFPGTQATAVPEPSALVLAALALLAAGAAGRRGGLRR